MELIACIVVTTFIGIAFKLFPRFGVHTFNAIVINYTVCLVLGTLLDPDLAWPFIGEVLRSSWFKFDILLGCLFIIGFNLIGKAIEQSGITVTAMIQRMSLILTVSFTVLLFKEPFGWMEGLGLVLALFAILAIHQKKEAFSLSFKGPFPALLAAVLVLSAALEILLYYVDQTGIVGNRQITFTTHGFGVAAIVGWLVYGANTFQGKLKITRKDVLAGIILGVPNFFSIFLILKMLDAGWKGSIMYPMVNVSVLLLSTFAAVWIFREKLNRLNWIGIGLASASILIIAFAHNLPR